MLLFVSHTCTIFVNTSLFNTEYQASGSELWQTPVSRSLVCFYFIYIYIFFFLQISSIYDSTVKSLNF